MATSSVKSVSLMSWPRWLPIKGQQTKRRAPPGQPGPAGLKPRASFNNVTLPAPQLAVQVPAGLRSTTSSCIPQASDSSQCIKLLPAHTYYLSNLEAPSHPDAAPPPLQMQIQVRRLFADPLLSLSRGATLSQPSHVAAGVEGNDTRGAEDSAAHIFYSRARSVKDTALRPDLSALVLYVDCGDSQSSVGAHFARGSTITARRYALHSCDTELAPVYTPTPANARVVVTRATFGAMYAPEAPELPALANALARTWAPPER
ncbi:hypothetical protein B0H17DRAFT_1194706 [Mycena rosella]|uniref:Uncharacterized protein n=1 Tax=Mycena rosella TaxID=1033263 RepID=A0AAD7GPY1_MYCRO|nr:hypothetical protein B0H17DRAFT_1194706 [Mycena rosella]